VNITFTLAELSDLLQLLVSIEFLLEQTTRNKSEHLVLSGKLTRFKNAISPFFLLMSNDDLNISRRENTFFFYEIVDIPLVSMIE
jgi:hypothetical protein